MPLRWREAADLWEDLSDAVVPPRPARRARGARGRRGRSTRRSWRANGGARRPATASERLCGRSIDRHARYLPDDRRAPGRALRRPRRTLGAIHEAEVGRARHSRRRCADGGGRRPARSAERPPFAYDRSAYDRSSASERRSVSSRPARLAHGEDADAGRMPPDARPSASASSSPDRAGLQSGPASSSTLGRPASPAGPDRCDGAAGRRAARTPTAPPGVERSRQVGRDLDGPRLLVELEGHIHLDAGLEPGPRPVLLAERDQEQPAHDRDRAPVRVAADRDDDRRPLAGTEPLDRVGRHDDPRRVDRRRRAEVVQNVALCRHGSPTRGREYPQRRTAARFEVPTMTQVLEPQVAEEATSSETVNHWIDGARVAGHVRPLRSRVRPGHGTADPNGRLRERGRGRSSGRQCEGGLPGLARDVALAPHRDPLPHPQPRRGASP